LSKLTKAYLLQGKQKFDSIIAVEMTIKKALSVPVPQGCDIWEIFLDMDDVWGLYKAYKKNNNFILHIEYTVKENGKPLLETVHGDFQIVDIAYDVLPRGKPHSVRGVSNNLIMSSKEEFIREKVQFT
jgi:hypothetical protein